MGFSGCYRLLLIVFDSNSTGFCMDFTEFLPIFEGTVIKDDATTYVGCAAIRFGGVRRQTELKICAVLLTFRVPGRQRSFDWVLFFVSVFFPFFGCGLAVFLDATAGKMGT